MRLTTQTKYLNSSYSMHGMRKKEELKKNYANKNNVNITESKPAQAISFGGIFNPASVTKTGYKLVEFVNENEAAYNAIYSLIVAGILKPAAVLNMPGSEDKDKQMVATKNFLNAFIGAFLGATISGGFFKKVIDNIKNNRELITINDKGVLGVVPESSIVALKQAEEILKKELKTEPTSQQIVQKAKELVKNVKENHLKAFEKNPEFLKGLKENAETFVKNDKVKHYKTALNDSFDSVWKNALGGPVAISKAMVASALLPIVLNAIFGKRNKAKELEQKRNDTSLLLNTKQFNQEKANFKPFNKTNEQNNISFKGNILNSAINKTTRVVEEAVMSPVGKGIVEAFAKNSKKISARMGDIESFAITGYWIQNTMRSKKIEQDRKFGFNLHTGLVTLVSSAAAFIIDWSLDGLIEKGRDKYAKQIKDLAQKVQENQEFKDILSDGIQVAKSKISKFEALDENQIAQYFFDKKIDKMLLKGKSADDILKVLVNDKLIADSGLATKEAVDNAVNSMKDLPAVKNIVKAVLDKNAIFNEKGVINELSFELLKGKDANIEQVAKNLTKNYGKKFSKFKSLTVFTLVVRFLVPVLMVPVSGKLKKKLVELTQRKDK